MEKETKPAMNFQECCDEVAKKLGQYVSEDHHKGCFYSRQVLKEAAELYNSETSKERDNALLSVALYVKELNDLKEERDRLKEELEKERTTGRQEWERLQLDKIDSFKQLNSELVEKLKTALNYMNVFMIRDEEPLVGENLKTDLFEIRSLIEKANQQKEKP